MATLACLESALSSLRITPQAITGHVQTRNASHAAQGRANKAKQGPGKRLGAKKTGGEYVIPGNILFKQRGTHWFPGENCFMVRAYRTQIIPERIADIDPRDAITPSTLPSRVT